MGFALRSTAEDSHDRVFVSSTGTKYFIYLGWSSRVEICIVTTQSYSNGDIIFSFNAHSVIMIIWVIPYQSVIITKMVGIAEEMINSISIL